MSIEKGMRHVREWDKTPAGDLHKFRPRETDLIFCARDLQAKVEELTAKAHQFEMKSSVMEAEKEGALRIAEDLQAQIARQEKAITGVDRRAGRLFDQVMTYRSQFEADRIMIHGLKANLRERDKMGDRVCEHMYESDCRDIEVIKSPSGAEVAIGGTNTKDRWTHDPWCGGRIVGVTERPATLSDCLSHMKKGMEVEEPEAPLIRIRRESGNGPECPECGSDFPRRYWIAGARHCVNPSCKLHKAAIEITLKGHRPDTDIVSDGYGVKAHYHKEALEMFEKFTYGKMTDRTKAMLKILASYGGRSYQEIETAYRTLGSLDETVACTDLACSANQRLIDYANEAARRKAKERTGEDFKGQLIEAKAHIAKIQCDLRDTRAESKYWERSALAHIKTITILAAGREASKTTKEIEGDPHDLPLEFDLEKKACTRQPDCKCGSCLYDAGKDIGRMEASREAGEIIKTLEARLAENEPPILKAMRKLMAKEVELREARAVVGDRDAEIVLLRRELEERGKG